MHFALGEFAGPGWIRDIHRLMIADALHRAAWDHRHLSVRGCGDLEVRVHAEAELLMRVGHLHPDARRARVRTDLRIDVTDAALPYEAGIGGCGDGGRAADTHAREITFVQRADDPDRREIDDREHFRRGIDVQTDVGGALGDDARDWRGDIRRRLNLPAWQQGVDSRCRHPEQYEARSEALDACQLRGMFRMEALQLLLTGRTNRDELRRSIELPLVRLELGLCGQVLRLRISQFRAEDLRQRLTAPHLVAELHEHARHAAHDERRDHDLLVGIGFDRSRDTHCRGAGAPRDWNHFDARSSHRLH